MIYQSVNKSQFRAAFHNMGRGEQFSYEGLGLLFDYYEDLSDDSDQGIELDVIAICCDCSEDDYDQIAASYDIDVVGLDDVEKHDLIMNYLNANTRLIGEVPGGFVYVQF